jgi:hypothetical protein
MQIREDVKERIQKRMTVGSAFGYFGLFIGLMALLTTTSEGNAFQRHEAAWLVYFFMVTMFTIGWVFAPAIARLVNPSR